MEIRLDGRAALITGGSKGLGLAMAEAFVGAGGRVAICARDAATLEQAKTRLDGVSAGAARAYPCDVTDPAAIRRLYADVVRDLRRVDILVNNAGHSKRGPFEQMTDEDWMDDLQLKLFAQIRLSRLCFPDMKARRWGRIINVINTQAKAPAGEGAPTAVSRAAGMALGKILSFEGAPHNVLVNSLCTGLIESDQWVRRHRASGSSKSLDEFIADMGRDLPMKRLGKAEEFAALALFLASDLAGYITGTAINVDGGRSPAV
ncbi:MAG: SDR family oxidoreductase [Alphaproteobacteria bacterium]